MFVFHLKVTAHGRVSDNLLELFLARILHTVTIEHGNGGDVLEGWLQSTPNHDILLHKVHPAVLLLNTDNFLILLDREWVEGLHALRQGLLIFSSMLPSKWGKSLVSGVADIR